jgi:protein O-GlcNAc transferase
MLDWLRHKFKNLLQEEAGKSTLSSPQVKSAPVHVDENDRLTALGNIYLEEGKYQEASDCYLQAIDNNPHDANAHSGIGLIYLQQNLPQEAMAHFAKALETNPQLASAQYFLGTIFQKQGKYDEAIDHYRKALELKADVEVVYRDLGFVLYQTGLYSEAKEILKQGLALNPDFAEFHAFLGNIYYQEKSLDNAINHYQKALSAQPGYLGIYLNMGKAFREQGKKNEAVSCYQQALAIKPDYIEALYDMAVVLAYKKNDEALSCLRKMLEINPRHFAAKVEFLHGLLHRCDWEGMDTAIKDIKNQVFDVQATDDPLPPPFVFFNLPGITLAEQRRIAENWAEHEYLNLSRLHWQPDRAKKPAQDNRIRIGYLSSDFQEHPVAYLMAGIFELHDRNRFHITAYSCGQDDGGRMRKRLERAFDKFTDVSKDSILDAAKKISRDSIDILVDLTGYTANTKSGVLALRPAPVQVNYLGFPGTMGAEFVDYLIADEFIIPLGLKKHYVEEVVWLPDSYMPRDDGQARLATPARIDHGLPDSGTVFCCFNQLYKITPEIFKIWCRLLSAIPNSVLWLPSGNHTVKANLCREAENHGIAANRLIFAPKLNKHEEHLARLQCADLFLDTTPYNAHSTCSDALWMGLPVITLAGETFPSRVAGSLLTAIGVPELVTYNLDDYYSLALDLATNETKLGNIRLRILSNRETAPLFNSRKFTRSIEAVYLRMYEIENKKSRHGQH